MQNISVNQLTTMRWAFDEDVVFYRSRGIKQIGVDREKAHDFGVEKCQELLNDAGMTVSSYGSLTISNDLTGPSIEEQVYRAHKEFEDAALLGTGCLIFHTGGDGGHLKKNRFCIAHRVIEQLLPLAEEYGVVLGVEPLLVNEVSGKCHSHSLEDCVELIDFFDTSYLGMVIDLFHVGNRFKLLSPEWFTKNVSLVQLSDYSTSGGHLTRNAIGNGDLDWPAFVRFLGQTGFNGSFEFEMYGQSFDFVTYQQVISGVADVLTTAPFVSSVELESIKA